MTNVEIQESIVRLQEKIRCTGEESRVRSLATREYWKDTCLRNLPNEKWKPIKRFEGKYNISNYGRIKSLIRKGSRVERILKQNKLISHGNSDDYYVSVKLSFGDATENRLVHVLVAEHFIPNPKKLKQVNHKNGIKTDNRASQLEWSDQSSNILHSFRELNRKSANGERHGMTTLTNIQVREIRKIYNPNSNPSRKLADIYGVSQKTILNIINLKTWAHLK